MGKDALQLKYSRRNIMRINNNLMAMNTHRQLGLNSNAGSKSIEKLSSGFRINRAGDDAAGLAISEKMRGQIRGLNQASRNAQDSISLVQTAEGALNESQAILQRMRELSVQSANDTNVDADRSALQNEVDQLATELTRITNNTEFNERKLLDGGLQTGNVGELTFHIGANSQQNVELGIVALDAFSLGVAADKTTTTVALDAGADDLASATLADSVGAGVVDAANITLTYNAGVNATVAAVQNGATAGDTLAFDAGVADINFNGVAVDVTATGAGAGLAVTWDAVNDTIDVVASTTQLDNTAANIQADIRALGSVTKADGSVIDLSNFGVTGAGDFGAGGSTSANVSTVSHTMGSANTGVTENVTLTDGTTPQVINITDNTATSLTVSTGTYQGVTVSLATGSDLTDLDGDQIDISQTVITAAAAAFTGATRTSEAVTAAGIDISTQTAADAAITTINTALSTVSDERAKLGAVQNRLEHTIKNLDTSSENLQASESRIRDVDMAKEMMEFTKNNILQQAAQAMLAQANQAPQGVLQLLR
jgi:flagellin